MGHKVARAMQTRGELRDRITKDIYVPESREEALGKYEHAMKMVEESYPVYKKLYKATKAGELKKDHVLNQIDEATEKGIITEEEAQIVQLTEEARFDAILVDEFTLEEYDTGIAKAPQSEGLKNPEKDTVLLE